MAHGHSDQHAIEHTHNTARFFTEWRHISWVLLIATLFWGVYGYSRMPQRKDPDVPIRQAMTLVRWPGARAEKIEQSSGGMNYGTDPSRPFLRDLRKSGHQIEL